MNETEAITGVTRGGKTWVPQYALSIDQTKCIGCGRCFKVCGREVMKLVGVDEEGGLIEVQDEDDEIEKKVMTLANPDNCIGCEACSRVCPKKCYTHGPAPATGV